MIKLSSDVILTLYSINNSNVNVSSQTFCLTRNTKRKIQVNSGINIILDRKHRLLREKQVTNTINTP